MKRIIGAVIGTAIGLGIGYWWLSSTPSVDERRAAAAVALHESLQADEAADHLALKGICDGGSVKALPSGNVAVCNEDAVWHLPTMSDYASQIQSEPRTP